MFRKLLAFILIFYHIREKSQISSYPPSDIYKRYYLCYNKDMPRTSTKNPDFDHIIGLFIRSRRSEKGIDSLSRLNKLAGLGLTKSALSGIELGKQQITAYQLFLIAKILEFSVDELYKNTDMEMNLLKITIKDKGKTITLKDI